MEIGGLIILIADVYAILQVAQSNETGTTKAIWIAVILVLPLLGVIAWYFLGPRKRGA